MEQKKHGRKVGTQKGELNNNYNPNREQVKSEIASFKVTKDVKEWLNQQPNKSKYIISLIRKDMELNNK